MTAEQLYKAIVVFVYEKFACRQKKCFSFAAFPAVLVPYMPPVREQGRDSPRSG